MSDQTREEVDAKLEAVEARLDAKLAGISAELRVISTQITTSIDASRNAQRAAERAEGAAITTRWNISFVALGTLGVVVALIVAFNSLGYQIVDVVRQFYAPPTFNQSAPWQNDPVVQPPKP